MVGVAGFEPATYRFQTGNADQTALHSDMFTSIIDTPRFYTPIEVASGPFSDPFHDVSMVEVVHIRHHPLSVSDTDFKSVAYKKACHTTLTGFVRVTVIKIILEVIPLDHSPSIDTLRCIWRGRRDLNPCSLVSN